MRALLLSSFLTFFSLVGLAQTDIDDKMSITTHMFLSELKGDIEFNPSTSSAQPLGNVVIGEMPPLAERLFVTPDTIEGKVYISCFVRLTDNSDTSELEALGVVVQNKFINGLITALIPIDKIEEVAAISTVTRINVSPLNRPLTNAAREKTNTDDVLTLSNDARAAGLSQGYDGTGVLLGVIDDGIDFQHIAFKDKNGNSRIKGAYVYNGNSATEYTSITSSSPTTDDNTYDHGTHTCTTAGGSSVIVNGNTVTVTDDHANATYGGMAPGADLYLAGINGLGDTYLSNAMAKIVAYADKKQMPVVVSNSWGSQIGPHDGTGDVADVTAMYFGDNHPNHICLFAASNDAGKSKDGEGGGYHLSGTASTSNTLKSILRSATYINTDAGYFYQGILANAWCRSTSVSAMTVKIHVLDATTGAVKTTVTVNPTTNGTTVSGLSTYYSGTLYAYKDYISSSKTQILLYSQNGLTSRSTSTTTQNGETYYKSNYTLAIEIYPTSGSGIIDVWGGSYGYFTNHLSTSGYSWKAGSDDMSVSDEAMDPNVISVGAYVSKNRITDYSGATHDFTSEYTMGDIAYFSSYATAAESSTGQQYPWITAPGARLVAGVNHYHTTSVDDYSYYGSNYNSDLVVNSTTYPYAAMEGTSMATPTAAGIVALWLQAAKQVGKTMTTSDIKEVMRETAIHDNYTTSGPNASHFGQGKIDALAGIQYILGVSGGPVITATPKELSFEGYATMTYTQTVTVRGLNLEGNITITKSGSNVFTVDNTSISATNAANGVELTITWSPTAAGTQTGTITLSSPNAESVTISLTGTAEAATPTILADQDEMEFTAQTDAEVSKTLSVYGRFLTGNVTATLNDPNGVFTLSATSLPAASVLEGAAIEVSFISSVEDDFTATLVLTSDGASPLTIHLSATANNGGTASDAYLNIAKYATIDDAGWNNSYVNTLYKYTEYENDEVAWLTLPVYGAWVGVYYNNHPQKWIESSLGTSNTYGGTSWNASSPLLGSSQYFTGSSGNGAARAIGYNSRTNTSIRTVSFYVTNTTAVKLYGTGRSGASSSYPARLRVYECTVNADGTLSAASNATQNQTSSSTSTFTLSATNLDEEKVYKVEASIYRGYIYEIGFQTSIEVEKTPTIAATPTTVNMSTPAGTSATADFTVTGENLTGNITVSMSDANGVFTLNKQSVSVAEAGNGTNVTVTFQPENVGNYSATITLSSTGAEPVMVTVTGVALQPEITATPSQLTLETEAGTPVTANFHVSGSHLADVVSVQLTDENNVFAIDTESISINEALEGVDVTVTFSPTEIGTYSGTVTLSTLNAEDATVTLEGTSTKPIPEYFDVTITSVGLTTLYLDFPVTVPYEEYDPDLLGAYYIYQINGNELKKARINSIIPAYNGVIVHGNAGTYRFPTAKGSTYQLPRDNYLTGSVERVLKSEVLAQSEYPDGKIYTLGRGGSDNYINFYIYNGEYLSANKAFLLLPGSTQADYFTFDSNDGNGILSISADSEHDSWYTPQGIKLNGKPTQRGIYIHNGKAETIQ